MFVLHVVEAVLSTSRQRTAYLPSHVCTLTKEYSGANPSGRLAPNAFGVRHPVGPVSRASPTPPPTPTPPRVNMILIGFDMTLMEFM